MLTHCATCGKEFNRPASLIIRRKSHYCSESCQHIGASKKVTISCSVCGKEITVRAYRVKRLGQSESVTCSRECKTIALGGGSKILYCEWCGDEFRRKNAQLNSRNFCSRECMGKWQSANVKGDKSPSWRGGYQPYYGEDWETRRKQAIKRDGRTCQCCGSSKRIEVHHIKPVRLFANPNDANALPNLITLCRACHVKADVLARWFFDETRRQSQQSHPLQNDRTIVRLYF